MKKLKSCAFLIFLLAAGCGWDDTASSIPVPIISAVDFLTETKYTSLTVEIKYVNGFQPSAAAVDNLKTFLEQRINKSAGITITQTGVPSPGRSVYLLSDLINIENASRTQGASGTALSLFIFFADADYTANVSSAKTLSLAYGTTSIAIFEKTIRGYAGGIGQPTVTNMETAVMLHAGGHILGLVGNGTPMVSPHQDTANGKHCDDATCLMYYKNETSDVAAALLGGIVPSLTQKCLDDLSANGGK